MDADTVRQRISDIPLMFQMDSGLASKLATILIDISSEGTAAEGDVLFTRGEATSSNAIILLEGEVSVEKEGFPPLTAISPELMGEMAQLNPSKQRTATVTATTELQLLRFQWSDFKEAIQRVLSGAELEKVSAAIQEYAWQHFTE